MIFLAVILGYYTLQHFEHVRALATNATIDDQYGDSVTGSLPSYYPENIWTQGNQCSTCFAQLNYQQTFDHTWHDATIHSTDSENELNVMMTFNGTAVYVYCILDNAITYTTYTNLTFSIDGVLVGSFSHDPDGSGIFLYNTLVYANVSVPNGNHIFVIHSPRGINDSLVLFDYMQYTYDRDLSTSPSSSTSLSPTAIETLPSHSKAVGAIAGGTSASVALLLIIGGILFLCCRRQHRSNGISHNPPNAPGMAYVNTDTLITTPLGPPPQLIAPPSSHLQRAEILREIKDRQQELVAALEEARPAQHPSFSFPTSPTEVDTMHRMSDAVLESQVEDLRREVTRLRGMLEGPGDGDLPQYRELD